MVEYKLPDLDDLPQLPSLMEIPSFETLEDENCAPCAAIKDELTIRCKRLTSDPTKVDACVTDLSRVVGQAQKSGKADGLRDQMYEVFLRYRENPPEPVESVAPAEGAVESPAP